MQLKLVSTTTTVAVHIVADSSLEHPSQQQRIVRIPPSLDIRNPGNPPVDK